MAEPITFIATFPAIQSAIIISGNGSGLQIKLEIPETELLNALSTIALREQAFKVTIEPLDDDRNPQRNNTKSTY